MPSRMDERVARAKLSGHYEFLREELQGYVDDGYSTRWIAAKLKLSRQTVITALRALDIELDRIKATEVAQHNRRVQAFVSRHVPAKSDVPAGGTPLGDDLRLVKILREWNSQWDRGW